MFINIAMQLTNRYYRLVAVGLGSTYAAQIFLTVGGGIKLIPMTGVTLPLVSYGGSSMLSTLIMFSIVQGLYILQRDEQRKNAMNEMRQDGGRYYEYSQTNMNGYDYGDAYGQSYEEYEGYDPYQNQYYEENQNGRYDYDPDRQYDYEPYGQNNHYSQEYELPYDRDWNEAYAHNRNYRRKDGYGGERD